jgi:hypothetical protein
MKLQHVGSYVFGGSLGDLAAIGAPATADGGALKKHREADKNAKTKAKEKQTKKNQKRVKQTA